MSTFFVEDNWVRDQTQDGVRMTDPCVMSCGIRMAGSTRWIILPLAAGALGKLYVGSGFEQKNITDKPKETSDLHTHIPGSY